jgi:hypothetical protein
MLKVGIASIPIALRLSTTSRRGVPGATAVVVRDEPVARRRRRSGGHPRSLSLYVDPARRPSLGVSGSRSAAVARQWMLRWVVTPDCHSDTGAPPGGALDRLDLPALAADWGRGNAPSRLGDAAKPWPDGREAQRVDQL